ncbi:hypothetical protein DFP73DRAFT_534899 [Morchella snyderi]|nr:hypothetical protein DFP73DRAFT_534899 [Morchella snyderi]
MYHMFVSIQYLFFTLLFSFSRHGICKIDDFEREANIPGVCVCVWVILGWYFLLRGRHGRNISHEKEQRQQTHRFTFGIMRR